MLPRRRLVPSESAPGPARLPRASPGPRAHLCAAWVLSLSLPMSSCTAPDFESALRVTVAAKSPLTSRCFILDAQGDAQVQSSRPVPIGTREVFIVAVARGSLPETVTLSIRGYLDEACTIEATPPEGSEATNATFVANRIVDVALRLRRLAQGSEHGAACSNGVDDDGDLQSDCVDPECEQAPCDAGDPCVVGHCALGACRGGTPVVCGPPSNPCLSPVGRCVGDAGCVYEPLTDAAACDDGDPCTEGDLCHGGACVAGPAKACTQRTGPCLAASGHCEQRQDAGVCVYPADPTSVCGDGSGCTTGGQCLADGGCSGGARIECAETACDAPTGQCEPDGGCQRVAKPAGAVCDAGRCDGLGNCRAPQPYVPSNFTWDQVPAPATGGVTLDCGQTVIDTREAGAPAVTNWCAGQPSFTWATVTQAGGPDAVLLSFESLHVAASAQLLLRGPRPAILVARREVVVDGQLVADPGAQTCGAGGEGAIGRRELAAEGGGGGGGGAFGSAGASGGKGRTNGSIADAGSADSRSAGGAPGAPEGNAELVPLRGGCPGGVGAGGDPPALSGGGAIQVSAQETLSINGVVAAPGGGGSGGPVAGGANGGGSGGAVLLEARRIAVAAGASVTANGGGGGEGGASAVFVGEDGSSGARSSSRPAGGGDSPVVISGGPGGGGASRDAAATNGGSGGSLLAGSGGGGGGGGGAGRIRFSASEGCSLAGSSILSPAATSNRAGAEGCP